MARDITLTEALAANEMAALARDMVATLFGQDGFRPVRISGGTPEELHERYEDALNTVLRLARPAVARDPIPFPESPPAPRSPGAAGGAAGLIPTGGAHSSTVAGGFGSFQGELITSEGLLDALTALHADLTDGHLQINLRDWPGEAHHYIMRHAARQSEAAEAAE